MAPSTKLAHDTQIEALLDETEVSQILGVASQTLRIWRLRGKGPKFCKIGRLAKYRPDELRRWIAASETTSTATYHTNR